MCFIYAIIMLLSRNSSVNSHEDSANVFVKCNRNGSGNGNGNCNGISSNPNSPNTIMAYDQQNNHHHSHLALMSRMNADRLEMCCNNCGNYTTIVCEKNLTKEEILHRENNFKCNKCKNSQKKSSKNFKDQTINVLSDNDDKDCDDIDDDEDEMNDVNSRRCNDNMDRIIDEEDEDEDADIGIDDDIDDDMDNEDVDLVHDNEHDDEEIEKVDKVSTANTTTLLKDNNTKPILKFSVSAILGDTREGVRVRNGKIEFN